MTTPTQNPIVTLTLNPAIDLTTSVKGLVPQRKLRCTAPTREPGGGGLNVARVIQELGGESVAVYTCGGVTGRLLVELMDERRLTHIPVEIEAHTRENFAVMNESTNALYRFVMPGPAITTQELARVGDAVREAFGGLARGGLLVLSGSMPEGVPEDVFDRVAEAAEAVGLRVVADVSGVWLRRAAQAGAMMLKPNLNELEEFVGEKLETDGAIGDAAEALRSLGKSDAVLVSMGPGGVLCVTASTRERVLAPSVRVRSTVGAGDSMVAGLTLAIARGEPLSRAVRLGLAAGTAACATEGTALCRREDVLRILAMIE